MVVPIKRRNNISFQAMQLLYNFINTYIPDINADRLAVSGQWVYPTVPEAPNELYPRIALLNRTVTYEEYGAGRYMDTERNASTGQAEHMVFGKIAIVPITIAVFVKRKQMHEVTYVDETTHTVRNSKQSDYLGELISKSLEMYKNDYFIPNKVDFRNLKTSRSYDDNDYLIAKNIDLELIMFDEWEYDFTDPAYNEGFTNAFETNYTVTQQGDCPLQ